MNLFWISEQESRVIDTANKDLNHNQELTSILNNIFNLDS